MKKHLLALLILLFLLIVTCVYQKTYTLYAAAHNDDNTSIPTQNVRSIASQENEIITNPETISEPLKQDTTTKVKEDDKTSNPIKVEKVVNTSNTMKKNESPASENIVKEKPKELTTPIAITKESDDKEIIAYLLSVLDERAEAEAKLHALIKQVLKDRGIAIENMHQVSLEIEKAHKERLIERDTKLHNNSEEEGK